VKNKKTGECLLMKDIQVVGYSDVMSVTEGNEINFKISCDNEKYKAQIVRIINGMTEFDESSLENEIIDAECNGEYIGYKQNINIGSYAELPVISDWLNENEFSVQFWLYPTLLKSSKKQVILSSKSVDGRVKYNIYIENEELIFGLVDVNNNSIEIKSKTPILESKWHLISAGYSQSEGEARLKVLRKHRWEKYKEISESKEQIGLNFVGSVLDSVYLAAEKVDSTSKEIVNHFNGKIENPCFLNKAISNNDLLLFTKSNNIDSLFNRSIVANYDFGRDFNSNKVIDKSGGNQHGVLFQGPTRAVIGHNWTGKSVDFKNSPNEYAAIHFHEDDLEDANWKNSLSWNVPLESKSGVYALKLESNDSLDYIPFYVRPNKRNRKSSVLFLAPTNTYLAYANEHLFNLNFDEHMSHDLEIAPQDKYIVDNPGVGKSLYDTHVDGSGVTYSSRLRPILNIRPHYRNWLTGTVRHLAEDLYITGWMEKKAISYEVATDEDLDLEGINLLNSYKVIVTGSHPEYWTRPMMESLEKYLADGGKLMYLGANGFYWVTSLDPETRTVAEVRRGNEGTRCWDSPPGEVYHSSTGEKGSLWRYNGYVPQEFVGVGFTAQGWGKGSGYKRLEDSFNPKVASFFEGIAEDEVIGDFGYVLEGAAGDEIDRFDFALGTPSHALRLATSIGLDDHYQFVHEDQLMTSAGQGGADNDLVRADITYFDIEGGGEVFSVGSICWAGSMAWNDYDNNVSKITLNVITKFADLGDNSDRAVVERQKVGIQKY